LLPGSQLLRFCVKENKMPGLEEKPAVPWAASPFITGGEIPAQAAQRGGQCPILGNIQGQVGRGSEQPDLAEDVPAHCRGLDWMALKGPFQPKPFHDSMILGRKREHSTNP